MRGEGQSVAPNANPRGMSNLGRLIDDNGTVKYHLISSGTTNLIIAAYAVLLVALVIMMVVVMLNRWDINRIEVEQEHIHNANTNTIK